MSYREAAQAVADAVRHARATGGGWFRVNCPLCLERVGTPDRRASLGVHAESGGYRCFRCHAKGRAPGFSGGAQGYVQAPEPEVKVDLPRGYTPLGDGPGATASTTARARAYLRGRGVNDATVKAARIGYCEQRGPRVAVPVLDRHQRLRGWVARTIADADPRYLNARGGWAGEVLFNESALFRRTDEPVLVMEGVFDALPYWPHAVAVLGKPTEQQVAAIAEARRPVAVCLDGDAADEGWALAQRLTLQGVHAGAVRLPPASDPATVDRQWLLTAASQALRTSC
jgi:hypothetical protein